MKMSIGILLLLTGAVATTVHSDCSAAEKTTNGLASTTGVAAGDDVMIPPRDPQEALASITVPDDLRVELVVSEPLVIDPVAIDFAPDGSLWVAEMHDYPEGLSGDYQPAGRVRILRDTDGDGQFDRSTVFIEKLPFPTGLTIWNNGALICAAPDILYAKDTDGDDRADVRKTLFTGFDTRNYQARVNSLKFGLDNWIYGANGLLGGTITSPVKSEVNVSLGFRDFRFHPETLELDLASGYTQQGRVRNDWGDWFGTTNTDLLLTYPMPDHYIRRNTDVAAPKPVIKVPEGGDPDQLFPLSKTLRRFNHPESANRVTAACSPLVYRDELLGPEYEDNAFICEPVHNIVCRCLLEPNGTTFRGVRSFGEDHSEFLASTDNWFRPVELRTGPDGAIWVVDMYRWIIEHPKWITADRLETLDLRAGDDRGRIYRIVPRNRPARVPQRLSGLVTSELAAALDHPNGWQRDQVQVLLVNRRDPAAVPVLTDLSRASERPEVRMQALCVLDGLQALTADLLARALADKHPGVRRHAIRLSEAFVNDHSELGQLLSQFVDDADPQVRFQLACSLGEWKSPQAARLLGQLAVTNQNDPYITAGVMSSLSRENLAAMADVVFSTISGDHPPKELSRQVLPLAVTFELNDVLAEGVHAIADRNQSGYETWQLDAIAAMLDGLDRNELSLKLLTDRMSGEGVWLSGDLRQLFAFARNVVGDDEFPIETRLAALRLLGRGVDQQAADIEAVSELLSPQAPAEIQAAAVATLGKLDDPVIPNILLENWRSVGPGLRSSILDALMSRDDWITILLDRIESKEIGLAEIDATRSQQLTAYRTPTIAERAKKLLAAAVNPDRQKVIDRFAEALHLQGDLTRGTKLFDKKCGVCHQLHGKGHAVGPNLVALTDKSPQAMLVAILDPNRAVEQKFTTYTAVTVSGLSHNGMLAEETGSSITLKAQENKQTVILRSELDELLSTGKSLMPDGLEKDVSAQDLADMMTYIAATGPSRRKFSGNDPRPVSVGDDGNLLMTAETCEIYGKTLEFEPGRPNLGEWRSSEDRADWLLDVPKTGTYTVSIKYSCQNDSSGNILGITAGRSRLTARIGGTGKAWGTYFPVEVGRIDLKQGKQRISLQAEGEVKGMLAKLEWMMLIPANK